jgi:hypothetical protein
MPFALTLAFLLALAASVAAQPGPSIELAWDAPAPVTGVVYTGYQLYRCELVAPQTACTCNPQLLPGATTAVQVRTYRDTTVVQGHSYCYSVVTLALVNNQPTQSPLAVPLLPVSVGAPPVAAPTALAVTVLVPLTPAMLVGVDSVEGSNPARYQATNALDGNPLTFWHTQFKPTETSYPHTLTLNLGQEWWLSGVRVWPRQDGSTGGMVAQWRAETSRDGQTWTLAGTTPVLPAGPAPADVRWASALARYVRVVLLSGIAPQAGMASIGEVQVIQGQAQ